MAEGVDVLLGINAQGAVKGAKVYKRSSDSVKKDATGMQKANQGVIKGMKGMGKAAMSLKALLPTVGAAFILTSAIGQAKKFEETMSSVQAVTGATGIDFEDLTAKAREMGATTQFTASEAAEGMKFLGMAGFETNEIIKGIGPSLDLAKAGALGLGEAADIMSNVMSGFNVEASESARVADVLAQTAASSNTSVFQLGDAMKYAAPVANALGMEVEETAAMVGVLANAGLQGSLGGTALAISMQKLLDVTPKGQEALAKMGLTVSDVNPEMHTMTEIVNTLAENNLSAADAVALFGARGAKGMLILTEAAKKAEGGLKDMQDTIDGSKGAAGEMADTMGNNLTGAMKELGSAISEVFISLATDGGLLGGMTKFIRGAADFVQGLAGMSDKLREAEEEVTSLHAAGEATRETLMVLWDLITDLAPWVGMVAAILAVNAALLAMPGLLETAAIKMLYLKDTMLLTNTAALGLKGSMLLLGAAFVGWQIGKWLREFDQVKIGAYVVVAAFIEVVERLKYMVGAGNIYLKKFSQQVDNAFNGSIAKVKEFLANLPFVTKAYEERQKAAAALYRGMVKDVKTYDTQLAELKKTRDANIRAGAESRDILIEEVRANQQATDVVEEHTDATLEYVEAQGQLVEVNEDVYKTTIDQVDGLQELLDVLDPLTKLQNDFAADVRLLVDNQERLEAAGYDVEEMLIALNKQFKEGTERLEESEKSTYPWGAAWENAIKRIDDAFFDLWKSAFDGFDSFMDSMEDALKTFAAQTFHTIFTKPIVDGIASMMKGGTFSSGSGGGGLVGYAKSLYEGASTGGFSGFAASALSPLSSLGTLGIQGMTGLAGMLPAGSALQTGIAGYTGSLASTGNTITSGMGFSASAGTNFAVGALANALAGYVGNQVGQMVFNNAGSTGIGSGIGGIAGSVIGGPLGAGIGAFLGEGFEKVLGDVFGFGGKPGNNIGGVKFDLGAGTSEEFGIGNFNQANADRSVAVLEAVRMFAESIGGSDLVGKIEASDRGWIRYNEQKYKDIDSLISQIFSDMLDAATDLEPGFKQLIKDFDGSAEELYSFTNVMMDTRERIKEGGMSLEKLEEQMREAEEATFDMVQVYKDQGDELIDLARNFDGTLESAVQLNEAIAVSDAMFLQMALSVKATKDVIEKTITALIEELEPVEMSVAEAFQQAKRDVWDSMNAIRDATNPADVEANVGRIIAIWNNMYGSMMNGLRALDAAASSVSETLQDSIRGFERDTMTDNQLAQSIEEQIQTLVDELPELTNPTDIENHIAKINTLTNELWDMLPDEDKIGRLQEFTTFLADLDTLVAELTTDLGKNLLDAAGLNTDGVESIQDMMDVVITGYASQLESLNEYAQTHLDDMLQGLSKKQQEINEELGTLLLGAADANADAAQIQLDAANRMNRAAMDFPRTVRVEVDVNHSEVVTG